MNLKKYLWEKDFKILEKKIIKLSEELDKLSNRNKNYDNTLNNKLKEINMTLNDLEIGFRELKRERFKISELTKSVELYNKNLKVNESILERVKVVENIHGQVAYLMGKDTEKQERIKNILKLV